MLYKNDANDVLRAMQGRRNALLVIHDILRCIIEKGGRARKTEVAQCSNLNTNVFNKYVSFLERAGILLVTRLGRNVDLVLTNHGLFIYNLVSYLIELLMPDDEKLRIINVGIRLENLVKEGGPKTIPIGAVCPRSSILQPLRNCIYYICFSSKGFCCVATSNNADQRDEEQHRNTMVLCCKTLRERVECRELAPLALDAQSPERDTPLPLEKIKAICS